MQENDPTTQWVVIAAILQVTKVRRPAWGPLLKCMAGLGLILDSWPSPLSTSRPVTSVSFRFFKSPGDLSLYQSLAFTVWMVAPLSNPWAESGCWAFGLSCPPAPHSLIQHYDCVHRTFLLVVPALCYSSRESTASHTLEQRQYRKHVILLLGIRIIASLFPGSHKWSPIGLFFSSLSSSTSRASPESALYQETHCGQQ